MKTGLFGLLLCGCVPQYAQVNCQYRCAPRPPSAYCYNLPAGYVLPQDKYDPSFVPCPPLPLPPVDQPDGEDGGDDGSDGGDDGDNGGDDGDDGGTEGQSSSTGGGQAHAQEGDQQSDASAGNGAAASDGDPGDTDHESSFSGGGRGAGATEGGVSIGANAGGLL